MLPNADVVAVITNNQIAYQPGTSATYTLTVTNNGPFDAENVAVTSPIPAGMTNFQWTGNSNVGFGIPLQDIIPLLPVGQSVTYTLTFTIPLSQTADIETIVNLTSDTHDPILDCSTCVDIDIL
ncbi:hypothetical protein V6O07_13610, partial [Arthrospira platensis SPKY2]